MLNVKLRLMKKADIDNVIELEKQVYGNHHWSKDSFINELNNDLARYYCVFNEEDKLVAYCGCWQILEEVHITNIAVGVNFRKQHIGELLLMKIIEDCYLNMVKYITLEVRVSNVPAISLYEKYGFKSLGTRKAYYQDNNEDALIMWTENIFYNKYRDMFDKNVRILKGKISYE